MRTFIYAYVTKTINHKRTLWEFFDNFYLTVSLLETIKHLMWRYIQFYLFLKNLYLFVFVYYIYKLDVLENKLKSEITNV